MKKICWLLVVLLLAGCGGSAAVSKKARYPNPVTADIKSVFDEAEAAYKGRRFSEADAALQKIITDFPYTEATDRARFLRGEISFSRGNYDAALGFYREAVSQIESEDVAPKARFKAALSLFKLKKYSEASEDISKIARKNASAILRLRMDSLAIKTLAETKADLKNAIVYNLFLLDDYAEAGSTLPEGLDKGELVLEQTALSTVKKWIDNSNVTPEEVSALPLKLMRGKRSGGFAAYKQALVHHTSGDSKLASRELKSYLTTYPKHEYYGSARLLMTELGGAIGEASGVVVGVLLPLSGKYSGYGESVLHGIECALGVYEPCKGPAGVKLVVRDSESLGQGAAVDELASEGVLAIIGPLASSGADEAAKRAEALRIPMIALTQRDDIAAIGDYVFRNSVSDKSEMQTLADYVVTKKGYKKFFIAYPQNKKASEYRALFTDAVGGFGGKVVSSQTYSAKEMIINDELRGRFISEQGMAQGGEGGSNLMMTAPTSSYDAVFVPDSIVAASYIAQSLALSASGNKNVKLVGISRWNDQKLVNKAGDAAEGSIFVDSFYRGAADASASNFVINYKGAYNSDPTLLEALGFDAANLILNAVREKGAMHRDSIRTALQSTSDYPGVTGKISFDDKGEAVRKLWVLTVRGGAITTVE